MATNIVQMTDGAGNKQYPVTSAEAVGMPDGSGNLQNYLNKRVTELNISELYPTQGIGGTNKYDLAGAIALVEEKYRTIQGLKISFVNENNDTESWEFKGGSWGAGSFLEVGARKFTELEKKLMTEINPLYSISTVGGYYSNNGTFVAREDSYKTTDLIEIPRFYSLKLYFFLYANVFGINIFTQEGAWISNYSESEGNGTEKEVIIENKSEKSVYVKCTYIESYKHTINLIENSSNELYQYITDLQSDIVDINKDIEDINAKLQSKEDFTLNNNGTIIGVSDGEDKYPTAWGDPSYIIANKNYILDKDCVINSITLSIAKSTQIDVYAIKDNSDGTVTFGKLTTIQIDKTNEDTYQDVTIDGLNIALPANHYLGICCLTPASIIRIPTTTVNNFGVYQVIISTNTIQSTSQAKIRYGFSGYKMSNINLSDLQEQIDNLQNNVKYSINILSFGNSYARDAFSYVPWILKSINPNIDIKIGILYSGACSVQTHLARINNGATEYTYWKFSDGIWTHKDNASSWEALEDEQWDIITMQEHSLAALKGWETQTKPYVNPLIIGIINKLNYNVQFAWCLTHTYAVGYEDSGYRVENEEEQTTMYNNIVSMSEWILNNCPVKLLIPWGTATQNTRQTTLNNLGDFGNGMSNDGLHLQEGIGCLIEAYTTVLSIFDILIQKYGIIGDKTQLDVEKIESGDTSYAIGGHIGTGVIGLTDDNIRIGQVCAVMANNFPTKVSDINAIITE